MTMNRKHRAEVALQLSVIRQQLEGVVDEIDPERKANDEESSENHIRCAFHVVRAGRAVKKAIERLGRGWQTVED